MWQYLPMVSKPPSVNSEAATSKAEVRRRSVFVVSPIGTPGTETYRNAYYALKYIFRTALPKEDGWDVHRADEGKSPDSIGQHVIKALHDADLVIADLTGHNPNVFYELAVAHGWRKPVVHLISKGESIPFDIVDQRTIFYDITDLESVEKTIVTLREYANHAIAHVDDLVTPLTNFAAFSQIRSDSADGGEAVVRVLEQVLARLSRLEAGVGGGLRTRSDVNAADPFTDGEQRAVKRYYTLLREKDSLLQEEPDEAKAEQLEQVEAALMAVLEDVRPSSRSRIAKYARDLASRT